MENSITLPEDVLVDILCRLPDVDLIRSKCVCKAWHKLISQVCIPRICLNQPTVCLTFATDTHPPEDDDRVYRIKGVGYGWIEPEKNNASLGRFIHMPCSASLPFLHSELSFLDSCNGLLLFLRCNVHSQYYVCNPTTKQWAMIPEVGIYKPRSFHARAFVNAKKPQSFCYVALAFNPAESSHYKVVRVTPFGPLPISVDIYFSHSNEWVHHIVELNPLVRKKAWVRQSAYLQGKLYRLTRSYHLVCFDLQNVVSAWSIELPNLPYYSEHVGCIGVSMGQLLYAKRDMTTLFVWVLHDRCDATEWLLKYNICISDIGNELCLSLYWPYFFIDRCWLEPATFSPNSDVIFMYNPGIILSYNLKSNTLKEISRTRGDRTYIWYIHPVFAHVRCVVSLTNAGNMDCESTQFESSPFDCPTSVASYA